MLEETKRKKQRMKDQRDQLMSQYHQIRSYLSRMQHPLIDATTETLDIDSSVLRQKLIINKQDISIDAKKSSTYLGVQVHGTTALISQVEPSEQPFVFSLLPQVHCS